jgi:U3 small nucleolar RNA-associated protein 12
LASQPWSRPAHCGVKMVKSYFRYVLSKTLGVIAQQSTGISPSNVEFTDNGGLVLSPCLQSVHVWNPKTGVLEAELREQGEAKTAQVTVLARSPAGDAVAVGYGDGRIKLWSLVHFGCLVTLYGHSSAVSALRFSSKGDTLISGSEDTTVIVWDPVAESGVCKFTGHKGPITGICLLEKGQRTYALSSSKDATVKVWDLDAQCCVQTVVDSKGAIWSVDVDVEERWAVCGSTGQQLRIYQLRHTDLKSVEEDSVLVAWDELARVSNKRTVCVRFDATSTFLACQTADKTVQFWYIGSDELAQKKLKRRVKRGREKASKRAKKLAAATDSSSTSPSSTPSTNIAAPASNSQADEEKAVLASDFFQELLPLRTKKKIVSFSFAPGKLGQDTVAVSLSDNSIHLYSLELSEEGQETSSSSSSSLVKPELAIQQSNAIEQHGHRSGVRSVAISHDCAMVCTTSASQIKIFNLSSGQCLKTCDSGYGLCCMFVPGDRYVVVGTKEGLLEVYDVNTGEAVQLIAAHENASIWALDPLPNRQGLVTAGSDQSVRFWNFSFKEEDDTFALSPGRSLQLTDDCMCVRNSPDKRFVAVGLLDATIKVFHEDSLEFFLSLYGHKLPVLCMDISSDSTLLVSGSADKNVKIWGLDFGDCHKSMFAHADSVMSVAWVHDTHYFFSAGKDSVIKYWDADKFELILTLPMVHVAPIWSLAISRNGMSVVTSGNDRSIRVFNQTKEQVFIEEEREKDLESIIDKKIMRVGDDSNLGDIPGAVMNVVTDKVGVQSGTVVDKEGMAMSEKLIDALEICSAEVEARKESKDGSGLGNPLFAKTSPEHYLLGVLGRIKNADLEEVLVSLPFRYVMVLLPFLQTFVEWGVSTERHVRSVVVLCKHRNKQIASNQVLGETLTAVRAAAHKHLKHLKNVVGSNIAALRMLHSEHENAHDRFFGETREALAPAPMVTLGDKRAADGEASRGGDEERNKRSKR